jgi:hypothetical protein
MFTKKYYILSFIVASLIILYPKISLGAEQFSRDLYFGLQQDSDVIKLQEFLTDEGLYSGPITGNFFSLTLKGVKNFQLREGVTPAAGYFGPKTRIKANAILSSQIQASENQAVSETGATTTSPVAPKTTTDIVNSLQSQINLLLQQIALIQQQLQVQQQNQANANTSASTSNQITAPTSPSPNSTSSADILEIISVNIVPDKTSAKIEWQTSKPTESKIFISGGNLYSKIFTSISGLSTRHSATITGLSEETTYSYEIEVIAGGINSVKKQGNFTTLPPSPLFEFNPSVRVGTASNEVGHVYISIPESFDSGTWSIKDLATGQYNIAPRSYTIGGRAVKPGEVVDLTGFVAGQTYEYKFTMEKTGYRSNTRTGTFTMSSSEIYTEKRVKPWPDSPSLHGEFMFWHYGSNLEGAILNLKIRVILNNPLSPNELKFYKSGIANLWQTFFNISNGDILQINSFPSNYQLVWSYSGNPDDLLLEIIEGTATKNGVSIPFRF